MVPLCQRKLLGGYEMPTKERQKIYWESCCWLSYINGIEERYPILDALLADSTSNNGIITIYTSSLSQVEVAFGQIEQDNHALDPNIEEAIDQLWANRDTVKLIDYYEGIGKEARLLMRASISRGFKLRPFDAIHLATAKSMRTIEEFHTYDEKLFKYSDDVGFLITQPHTLKPKLLP